MVKIVAVIRLVQGVECMSEPIRVHGDGYGGSLKLV
jgi:hypothetical protein